jgi:hypothetical protein
MYVLNVGPHIFTFHTKYIPHTYGVYIFIFRLKFFNCLTVSPDLNVYVWRIVA